MTVCIGAICQWQGRPMIVGASDRMITYEDTEFEPSQSKIFNFTSGGHNGCVALVAGDSSAQITICNNTFSQIKNAPPITIQEIAKIYALKFAEVRLQSAVAELLTPIGITLGDLRGSIDPALRGQLIHELRNHRLSAITIIAGVDADGAHLYIVSNPGYARCVDPIGFAAIGYGERHAESQFMFAKYTRTWSADRAMLLTYISKKRAEVAPSVGTETDMFFIDPIPSPVVTSINPQALEALEKIYKARRVKEEAVSEESYKEMEAYLRSLIPPQPSPPQNTT